MKSALVAILLLLLEPTATVMPPSPPSPGEIPGYTSVSVPLDATGTGSRYDVGGGNNYASELSEVPWQSLQPGDVVNIYYRATPYKHKILLSEQGTAENPIVINGVSDSSGTRPTISADGAVSVNPEEWNNAYRATLIMINKREATGTDGINAKHYLIQNLRLANVRPNYSYTHNGVTENYEDWSRAIWSAGGQHITLQGMVIENNGSGVFVQANEDPESLSRNWTIRGSKFENNGFYNRDHQIYLQSVSVPGEYNIVEGNYFGPPTPNQNSIAQLKIRSTGVIVRYNYFESAHRTLDLVEAQDAIPNWMYENYTQQQVLENYRTSYIYGNIFVNDFSGSGTPGVRPLHFGADSLDGDALFSGSGDSNGEPGMRGYQSPTYFYNNTFYMRASYPPTYPGGTYRGVLFDLENNNSTVTPTPGTVDAWNNIFEFAGNTRIGALNRSGTVNFLGKNLLYTGTLTIFAESDRRANLMDPTPDPNTTVNYPGEIITDSAGFTSPGYELNAGSPAIGESQTLPSYLPPVNLQPNGKLGGATLRPSSQDLGAMESP